MSETLHNLRLQIAQFNNFIIENYLAKVKNQTARTEPYLYLFDAFFRLSESLSVVGSAFGNIDDILIEDLAPLQVALADAAEIIYIIEKAADTDELALIINGINTRNLNNSLQNIIAYGKEFNTSQNGINAEIEELKQDNEEYFNADGSFKFSVYHIQLNDIITYLSNNATLLQVKNAFKKVNETYQYICTVVTGNNITGKNYSGDGVFLGNLLNSLTVLLIALGYIEPFFQKPDEIIQYFDQQIKGIAATQAIIFNTL